MSFGDRIETRSELEAAELDRENRIADRLATNVPVSEPHGKAPMTQDERSKMEIAWADRRCDTVQRDGFVDGWTAAYAEVADLKRRLLNAEYALEHEIMARAGTKTAQ